MVRCIICTEEKPVVNEEYEDNRRYGECQSDYCVSLRELPDATLPLFNTRRLANDREIGMSQLAQHKEAIDTAKAEGREDQIGMRR